MTYAEDTQRLRTEYCKRRHILFYIVPLYAVLEMEALMTRTWRDYNYFLIGCVIVLVGFSLAMVYSATLNDAATHGYFARHLVNLIVGAAAMLLLTVLDYHALQSWARPLYIGHGGAARRGAGAGPCARRSAELAQFGAAHVSAIRGRQAAADRRAGGLLVTLR